MSPTDIKSDRMLPFAFVKLLSHDLRWKMIQYLTESDYRVYELVDYVNEPMNLVSYHLKKLRDADIVLTRRSDADGRDVYYTLNLQYVHELYEQLGASIHPAFRLLQPEKINQPQKPLCILILCKHNSARSQIAEGLLRELGGEKVDVYSAGIHPTKIHPDAIRVMRAMNIDITGQSVNHVNDYLNGYFDYVITICDYAREVCPVFDSKIAQLHWGIADPANIADPEERDVAFRQIANFLKSRTSYFLQTLP